MNRNVGSLELIKRINRQLVLDKIKTGYKGMSREDF